MSLLNRLKRKSYEYLHVTPSHSEGTIFCFIAEIGELCAGTSNEIYWEDTIVSLNIPCGSSNIVAFAEPIAGPRAAPSGKW